MEIQFYAHVHPGFLALVVNRISFNSIKNVFLSVKNKNHICKDYVAVKKKPGFLKKPGFSSHSRFMMNFLQYTPHVQDVTALPAQLPQALHQWYR